MSDFWKKRIEARWDYEQYNKGSVGLFYKVVAVLEDDGKPVYSVMCELIRHELTAVSIVEAHNKAIDELEANRQDEDMVKPSDMPRLDPKYLITVAIMSHAGGENFGEIADQFFDDAFFESYTAAREWLRPWESFIGQYEDWGSMVTVWSSHIPDEPPVD